MENEQSKFISKYVFAKLFVEIVSICRTELRPAEHTRISHIYLNKNIESILCKPSLPRQLSLREPPVTHSPASSSTMRGTVFRVVVHRVVRHGPVVPCSGLPSIDSRSVAAAAKVAEKEGKKKEQKKEGRDDGLFLGRSVERSNPRRNPVCGAFPDNPWLHRFSLDCARPCFCAKERREVKVLNLCQKSTTSRSFVELAPSLEDAEDCWERGQVVVAGLGRK